MKRVSLVSSEILGYHYSLVCTNFRSPLQYWLRPIKHGQFRFDNFAPHLREVVQKQARKSSEDTQVCRYARFEKVWAGKLRIKKSDRFSKVIFGSARLYSVQQGYIRFSKVI